MISSRRVRTAVLGAMGLALVAATLPAQAAVNAGRGTDPYLNTGGLYYDVVNYNVGLTYDPKTHGLLGSTAQITATAQRNLSSFTLDMSNQLAISTIVVNGKKPRYVTHANNKLTISTASVLPAGQRFIAIIGYSGTPRAHQDSSGRGDVGWVKTVGGAVTFTEPDGTHEWVPSNDVLYDKATWNVKVRTPSGLLGVSTGRLTQQLVQGSGATKRVTTTWVENQPITPYQQVIAIDAFSVSAANIAGLRSYVAVSTKRPAGGAATTVSRMAASTSTALTWLKARLGSYPYADTGAIVVSGGDSAMETATRPTYSNDQPYDFETGVVVHELAHQWFAGRLTATNVADLWLHEAFATWFEDEWRAGQPGGKPRVERIREQYLDDGFTAETTGQFGKVSVQAPTNAYRLESTVYHRGAAAVEELKNLLGDQKFFALLTYLGNQPMGHTFTTDQVVAMATTQSGVDLSGWRATWLASTAVQTLSVAPTNQQIANEIGSGPAQELYYDQFTTVTPAAMTAAVNAIKTDAPWWVPYRSMTAGTTSTGTYTDVSGSTPVSRINLVMAATPVYGAAFTACLTFPTTPDQSTFGDVWWKDDVPLSTTFAPDTITLQACPA